PVDLNSHRIFARFRILSDIKFSRCHTSLTISYLYSINPNIKCTFYSPEMDKEFTAIPIIRHNKFSTVRTYRITQVIRGILFWWCFCYVRRFHLKWIYRIGINRYAITLWLPTRWDFYYIPAGNIKRWLVKILRPISWFS